MYLFDTDVLIWILRGNKKIVEWTRKAKEKKPISISVISIAEIYKNIFPSEIPQTEKFLNQHVKIPVVEDVAKQAGLYWQEYSPKFKNISLTDCLIASTVRVNNCELVTLNSKHFPMQDIKVISPGK